MKESFSHGTSESPDARAKRLASEYKKRYEALPAARPHTFTHPEIEGQEARESPFAFPPMTILVTSENIKELTRADRYTESELWSLASGKRLEKLRVNESIYGEYEITCIMRMAGDNNRIDKAIGELDIENPWLAGKIEHLLLLGLIRPDLIEAPTVALGSTVKQNGNVPCLEKDTEGRITYVNHSTAFGFNQNYRFLVFRKKG